MPSRFFGVHETNEGAAPTSPFSADLPGTVHLLYFALVSNIPSIGLSWVLTCEEDRGLKVSWPSLIPHPDGADADPVITVRSQIPLVNRRRGSRKGEDLYTYDMEHGHHGAA